MGGRLLLTRVVPMAKGDMERRSRRSEDGPSSPIELVPQSASHSVTFPCVWCGVSALLDQRYQDPQQKALSQPAQCEQKINHCGPLGSGFRPSQLNSGHHKKGVRMS